MFLPLVHLRDLVCSVCGAPLAGAGSRSFVVDGAGGPVPFDADDQPAEMRVDVFCANGHPTPLFVPNEISAEESMLTPDDAPVADDAVLVEGRTESGKPLSAK